ncbi:MAG: glycosyltransferase family 4 protein [Caldilinea sp. CFX5]|nr:glycosyltransferase family 4 protein [Caldilinea sp. CFX5]
MRVVMVSKALVVGAYQRKAEEIARLGVALTVLTPPSWRDSRGEQVATAHYTNGYTFQIIPIRFNGQFHLHYYPTLTRQLKRLRPDILHFDEEPYNLATWLGVRAGIACGAVPTFFTWQNLAKQYPPPFRWFEQAVYRRTPIAIAGNQDAKTILRQKGFSGDVAVIPQFGVDPLLFAPATSDAQVASTVPKPDQSALRIGYAGGLVPEKGLDLLLRACAALQGPWTLQLAGRGAEEEKLRQLARQLGIAERVAFQQHIASTAMPAFYQSLDLLVLPSRTMPNWKEQFGRVLVEAMACGVPVIGSDSGEIPHVIGAAGLLFPEGDAAALRQRLQQLLEQPAERQRLGMTGRQRVLQHFTMQQIAAQTVQVYEKLSQSIPAR